MKIVELINKSISAAILISLGNYALLKLGNPIGPVIFAFGLLGVCNICHIISFTDYGISRIIIVARILLSVKICHSFSSFILTLCFLFCYTCTGQNPPTVHRQI